MILRRAIALPPAWIRTVRALAALSAAILAVVPFATRAEPPPVIADIQITASDTATTIRLIASQAITPRVSVLTGPDRIIVDLPQINFQLPPDSGQAHEGMIRSFRYGGSAPGKSRIVFDLTAPALPSAVSGGPILGGAAHTALFTLAPTDRASFEAAARAALSIATQSAVAVAPTPAKPDGRPLIVIDPGHGGADLGATGVTGLFEKDVVLSFAIALKRKIEEDGRVRAALTRDHDLFIPLDERVHIAERMDAQAFISIHADTIASSADIRGMTIYTMAEKASDADAARIAEAENRADLVGTNAGVMPEDTAVAGILGDLAVRETRTLSGELAHELVGRLADIARLNHNPLRAAGFRVLRAPGIPSALIEIGYMSSKTDIDLLTSEDWTNQTTTRIAAAVSAFVLAAHPAGLAGAPP